MFLDVTSRRNPRLLDAAVMLHQTGQILPDTYVLDLDTIEHNVKINVSISVHYPKSLFLSLIILFTTHPIPLCPNHYACLFFRISHVISCMNFSSCT